MFQAVVGENKAGNFNLLVCVGVGQHARLGSSFASRKPVLEAEEILVSLV
jgi:hypothetical protein